MTPLQPISPLSILHAPVPLASQPLTTSLAVQGTSFSQLLTSGLNAVNDKANAADAMVRAFALDDSVPVHQVTFALMQSQLSVELMMQVRSRLVEGYQQLMNMQL